MKLVASVLLIFIFAQNSFAGGGGDLPGIWVQSDLDSDGKDHSSLHPSIGFDGKKLLDITKGNNPIADKLLAGGGGDFPGIWQQASFKPVNNNPYAKFLKAQGNTVTFAYFKDGVETIETVNEYDLEDNYQEVFNAVYESFKNDGKIIEI